MEPIRFSDNALFKGWGNPMRSESTIDGLEIIQGAIPAGLEGTLYRNGADWQYPSGRDDDIFIDGEGMFHMFRFEDGQVSYRSRWVHTERYEIQRKARRSLFGRYRNRYTNAPEAADANMGSANTTAMFHAGHLYALKEDDHPYAIDPDTLATIGRTDMNGQISANTFTAHPKLDPITNELLAFAYQARGDGTKDIVYYLFDKDGKLANEVWFEMPYAACVHDFAVTDEWIVFPFFPLITDMDAVKKGGNYFQWNPDQDTHIALVPRYGDASGIRWFKGPASSAGHMMNAVREGNKVHLDLCLYEGNCFPFFTTPQGEVTPPVPPFLTRITLDLASNDGAIAKKPLLKVSCEMPRTDDRYQGRPYRYGYMIVYRSPDGWIWRRASLMSGLRGRGIQCRNANSCRAGPMRRKGTAGCWCRSHAYRKGAAIWWCSTRWTLRQGRWQRRSCPCGCALPSMEHGCPRKLFPAGNIAMNFPQARAEAVGVPLTIKFRLLANKMRVKKRRFWKDKMGKRPIALI